MKNADMPINPILDSEGKGSHTGLTKREYFAAKALQGLIIDRKNLDFKKSRYTESELSEAAVLFADTLIEALAKVEQE